jgi:hypothetical protein
MPLQRTILTEREKRKTSEAIAASDVVWERGLLKKGVGLCHGISGNAYLFLYLFRVTLPGPTRTFS